MAFVAGAAFAADEQNIVLDVEVLKWLCKVARQGYMKARNNLGVMYQEGKSVEQDYKPAAEWYRKAAEQGGTEATEVLRKFDL